MTTIDAHGNSHRGASTPGAGQFASRTSTPPAGTLTDRASVGAASRIRTWYMTEDLATAQNNDMIGVFEEEHPNPTADDYRAWLESPAGEWVQDRSGDEVEVFDGDDRRDAVRAISARLATGQAGILTEAGSLQAGDRVDLSRLWADQTPETVEFATGQYGVIESQATETADGDTIVTLSNFDRPIVVPTGTAICVQGVTFHGARYTERDLARKLIRDGDLAPAAKGMLPRDAIDQYIEANALTQGDEDYPEVIL